MMTRCRYLAAAVVVYAAIRVLGGDPRQPLGYFPGG